MIYAYEVQEALTRLEEVGVDIIKDDYVLYAGKFAEFSSDLFPLPIIVLGDEFIPNEVAYISKRDPRFEFQTLDITAGPSNE